MVTVILIPKRPIIEKRSSVKNRSKEQIPSSEWPPGKQGDIFKKKNETVEDLTQNSRKI